MMDALPSNGPDVLPSRPAAGMGLHFTSLPSPYGIGDIGDAALGFVDALTRMNLRVWQFLPTGPTAYGDSPYQPLSAFAGNANLIGLEPLVRAGLLSQEEIDPLRDLPAGFVDYGALIPRKRALLERAARRFPERAGAGLKSGFDAFLELHRDAWLADYALYRILKRHHGERPWYEWPAELAHRDPGALNRARREHAADIGRIEVLQFLFDEQWQRLRAHAATRGVRLFGDMPIYIALDSSDAWAHREILRVDADGRPSHVAGVPPDYFSEDGQLWGNPLYDWDHHARNGYAWWIERVRHAARQCDLVRIDHFRGFESYWAVPSGHDTAREGAWEPGPGDALFEAIARAMGALPIVAEDLGIITDEVTALRLRHGIPGMVVLQFAVCDPEFDPAAIAADSVCYTGTHDNDTTLGWFQGGQGDTRSEDEVQRTREVALRWSGGQPETIHRDFIRLAFRSPSRLVVIPMQDFLGLGAEARMNVPGSTRDNWRWRLDPGALTPAFQAEVAALVGEYGRA